jgi:hypothetical protein
MRIASSYSCEVCRHLCLSQSVPESAVRQGNLN